MKVILGNRIWKLVSMVLISIPYSKFYIPYSKFKNCKIWYWGANKLQLTQIKI